MFKFQGYVRREKKEQVVNFFFFSTKLLTNPNTQQHREQRK